MIRFIFILLLIVKVSYLEASSDSNKVAREACGNFLHAAYIEFQTLINKPNRVTGVIYFFSKDLDEKLNKYIKSVKFKYMDNDKITKTKQLQLDRDYPNLLMIFVDHNLPDFKRDYYNYFTQSNANCNNLSNIRDKKSCLTTNLKKNYPMIASYFDFSRKLSHKYLGKSSYQENRLKQLKNTNKKYPNKITIPTKDVSSDHIITSCKIATVKQKDGTFHLRVFSVIENSLFYRMGIRKNDLIIAINQQRFFKPRDIMDLMDKNAFNDNIIEIDLLRKGEERTSYIQLSR